MRKIYFLHMLQCIVRWTVCHNVIFSGIDSNFTFLYKIFPIGKIHVIKMMNNCMGNIATQLKELKEHLFQRARKSLRRRHHKRKCILALAF